MVLNVQIYQRCSIYVVIFRFGMSSLYHITQPLLCSSFKIWVRTMYVNFEQEIPSNFVFRANLPQGWVILKSLKSLILKKNDFFGILWVCICIDYEGNRHNTWTTSSFMLSTILEDIACQFLHFNSFSKKL